MGRGRCLMCVPLVRMAMESEATRRCVSSCVCIVQPSIMGFMATFLIESLDHRHWNFFDEVPMSYCGIFLRAVELFSEKNFAKNNSLSQILHTVLNFCRHFWVRGQPLVIPQEQQPSLSLRDSHIFWRLPRTSPELVVPPRSFWRLEKKSSWSPRTFGLDHQHPFRTL
jgi:hypothetical protein